MSTTERKRRVLVIAIDSADWPTLERMMAAGHLPNLRALRDRSGHWPLRSPEPFKSEASWTTFLSGQPSEETRYWSSIAFDPRSYEVRMAGALDVEPFFALGDRDRDRHRHPPHGPLSAAPGHASRRVGRPRPAVPLGRRTRRARCATSSTRSGCTRASSSSTRASGTNRPSSSASPTRSRPGCAGSSTWSGT